MDGVILEEVRFGEGGTMVSFHEKGEKILNLHEIWYRVFWYQNKTFL